MQRNPLFLASFFFLVCGTVTPPDGYGQTNTGEILGTVMDATSAVIPGVSITLTEPGTGTTKTTVTDGLGSYIFSRLLPMEYSITAEQSGFKKYTVSSIRLLTAQRARIDIRLEVGGRTEAVEVRAGVVLLETDTVDLGQVIDERRIKDLPLNGRTFLQLAALSAGVLPQGVASGWVGRAELGLAIDGQKPDSNSYLLDGIETQSARFGNAGMRPSVDAIQEFKLQRSAFSAEFGHNQGVINTSIKSGTNEFHGTFFEFLRNNELDARNFFDGKARPPFKQNNFRLSVGGPIQREGTFFFVNYEGFRQRLSQPRNGLFPSRAQLEGRLADDSAGTGILPKSIDPKNGIDVIDPLTGSPFPGNVIPASRISPTFKKIVAFIPAPTVFSKGPLGSVGFNTVAEPSNINDWDQFHIRIDHKWGSKDQLLVRYSWSDEFLLTPSIPPSEGTQVPLAGQNVSLGQTHIFGPRTVNEFRAGYNRASNANAPEGAFGRDVLKDVLGFKNTPTKPVDFGMAAVSMLRFSGFGGGSVRFEELDQLFQLVDNLSFSRGKHNFKTGFDYRRRRYFDVSDIWVNPSISFFDRYTRVSLADAMLGYVGRLQVAAGDGHQNLRNYQLGFYFQDDYKVMPKLTLNLGLRWEYNSPAVEVNDRRGAFINGKIVLAGKGIRRSIYDPDLNDWSPRLGFAYQVTPRTVIRAGGGVYYSQTFWLEQQAAVVTPPFFALTSFTGHPTVPDIFLDSLLPAIDPANPGFGATPRSFWLPYRSPYAYQWNLNVQRELTKDLLLEIAYAASSGHNVGFRFDQNQPTLNPPGKVTPPSERRPYPQFQEIQTYANIGKSNYNSMSVRVERRFAQGFTLLSNWTLSHAIDTGINDYKGDVRGNVPGFGGYRINRASSSLDARHIFITSFIWELPFGHGKPFLNGGSILGKVVGGWQVNGITTFASGRPFDISMGGDRANLGTTLAGSQRPNRVGPANCDECRNSIRTRPRLTEYFRTSDFQLPPFGSFGNSGRNPLIGPGTNNWDLALLRDIRLAERWKLQFRAEFFNAFNHAQFNAPGSSITSPGFGQITSAREARDIQFGLKLIF